MSFRIIYGVRMCVLCFFEFAWNLVRMVCVCLVFVCLRIVGQMREHEVCCVLWWWLGGRLVALFVCMLLLAFDGRTSKFIALWKGMFLTWWILRNYGEFPVWWLFAKCGEFVRCDQLLESAVKKFKIHQSAVIHIYVCITMEHCTISGEFTGVCLEYHKIMVMHFKSFGCLH